MKKVSIFCILCFCVFLIGCGEELITHEFIADQTEINVEIFVSEERPALVRVLVEIPGICEACLKEPLELWWQHIPYSVRLGPETTVRKTDIQLDGRFTSLSYTACECATENWAKGEILMWLPEGQYRLIAGWWLSINFRIDADGHQVPGKRGGADNVGTD